LKRGLTKRKIIFVGTEYCYGILKKIKRNRISKTDGRKSEKAWRTGAITGYADVLIASNSTLCGTARERVEGDTDKKRQ